MKPILHDMLGIGLILALALILLQGIAAARPAPEGAAHPVQLPYSFQDNFGTQWNVMADGTVGPGNVDIFDAGGKLFVGNQQFNAETQTASLDAGRNELVFPVQHLAALNVTRRVAVNPKDGSCRWVEVLENSTGAPIKTDVHVNFQIGGSVQQMQVVTDGKKSQPCGVAIFDGSRGIAFLGAGHGSAIAPVLAPQQNTDQININWDVEVPANKTVAIVHLSAIRPTIADAQTFLEKLSDADAVRDLPAEVLKVLGNFTVKTASFGSFEILRGDLLDVVELRGGDQYKGTIQEKTFSLQTPYGPIVLPAEKVLAMITVGDFHPTQLFVTRNGEAFGGTLSTPVMHLQLGSGQVTPIPLGAISRMGYRKTSPDEAQAFKYDHPMLLLRNGDRIAVEAPADAIPAATRYGNLMLKPAVIGALVFESEEQVMHELLLIDGSRIAALISQESLELKPLTNGAGKLTAFPASSVSRLQIAQHIDEPGELAGVMTVLGGDRLVGTVSGKLLLETAFDTIEINGPEVRGLVHAGSAAGEVQVTLWDDASVSGRLKGESVEMLLKSGLTLHVPAALIDQYIQPLPQPPAIVLDKIRAMVADLGSEDWKQVDRASASLKAIGPKIAGTLRILRPQQSKAVQDRLDKIVGSFETGAKPAPVVPEAVNPGIIQEK